MNLTKDELGKKGEDIAISYLTGKGYEIIKRNYRYSHGEIDIIAKEKDTIVFVEVKTRYSTKYGNPAETISINQQKQIRKTTQAFIYENPNPDYDFRIDVIGILFANNEKPQIEHYTNAF